MATPVPLSKEQSDRKMALLKRSGLFGGDTGGARITRAATLEDLRAAYKLVHKVYLGTGFIKAEDAGMRLRIFETTSDTATFIAKKDGKVVGVLSIIEDTPELGLPSDSAFKEELDVLRAMGRKLGEVTNQAVDEEFRKTALPTELMRCAIAHGFEMGFDMGIATVSPSHNGFYELLGFRPLRLEDEPWSGPRSYSNKLHDPVVALRINLNDYRRPANETEQVERFVHKFLGEENPYTAYVSAWEERARRSFLHADLLEELFVRERNFLAECTADELKVLERRWGRELFRVVTSDQFLPVLDGLGVVAPKPDGIGKRETPPPPGQN